MNIKFAEKVYRVLFVFVFVVGMIGTLPHEASAQGPDPTFNVTVDATNHHGRRDWVEGHGWTIGQPLNVSIDDPDTLTKNPDASLGNIPVIECAGWPGTSCFDANFQGLYNIQVGDLVTVIQGSTVKTHQVLAIAITSADPVADVVSGTADPFSQVQVNAWNDVVGANRQVTADGEGNWSVDFTDSDPETVDLELIGGMYLSAARFDADGNGTSFGDGIPYPNISASIQYEWVLAKEWTVGAVLQLFINDSYITSLIVEPPDYGSETFASFDLGERELHVGDEVRVSDGSTTRDLTISPIAVTQVNTTTDTISGVGTPGAEAYVAVRMDEDEIWRRITPAEGTGAWEMYFGDVFDIQPGSVGTVQERDADDDSTLYDWRVPNPTFGVRVNEDRIDGWDWDLGSTVTIQIDDPSTAEDPEPVTTMVATAPWDETQTTFEFSFDDYDLKPGDVVTISGGNYLKQLTVSDASITDVDLYTDTVSGIADPGQHVNIWACWQDDPCVNRDETAGQDGNWSTNFAVPGEQDWEQETADLQVGWWIDSAVNDEDGDQTMFGWSVPNPSFTARLNDNEVHGYSWPLGAPVTLTIDDPTTLEAVDYTRTQTVIVADWDPNQTFVQFRLWEDDFTLEPSMTITMSDGTTTKTHVVTPLTVTNVDPNADTVSGTAPSGSRVDAWYCNENGCVNRHITAQGGDITGSVDAAQIADQFIPSIMMGYNEAVVDYDYNPTLARDLLTDAGYPNGFTVNLWLRDVPRVYLPHAIETAHAIQDYLGDVGITVNIEVLDSGEMLDRTWNGEADLYLLGWGADFDHPDNFYYFHFCFRPDALGLGAINSICDQVMDARAETDAQAQVNSYEAISQQIHDEIPLVPLAHVRNSSLFRQDVNGFVSEWYGVGTRSFLNATLNGNELTYAIPSEPTGLDPAPIYDGTIYPVSSQIMETLVRTESGVPVPGLAESWSVSADGLTWTFTIRSGVMFHDGTPLDAAAVLFNLERWWDPANPYHDGAFDYFGGLFNGFKGDPNSLISNFEAVGNNQIQITLREPFSPLLSALAAPSLAIANPTAIQAGTLDTHPVGTGPFVFVDQSPDGSVHLTANANYWDGTPSLTNLNFKVIPDESARYAALQANVVQGMQVDSVGYALMAQDDPNLQVVWHPEMNVGYLGINQSHGPLGNDLVREAISYAIDKQTLLSQHYNMVSFGEGDWVADFANPGDENDEQSIWDIKGGEVGDAQQCDEDGDCTQRNWKGDWVAPDTIPLVVAMTSLPNLNHPEYTLEAWAVYNLLWEPLFRTTDQATLEPAAASNYSISPDGLTYTITLRDDLLWSDGTPVTAQDYVDGLLRILSPGNADVATLLYDIQGAEDFNIGVSNDSNDVGLRALNDHTLEITLAHPAVYFPRILADPVMAPARTDFLAQYGDAWTEPQNFVGNGPYTLAEYDSAHILVQKNPQFHNAANIALEQIAFDIIPNQNEQFEAYQRGEVDVLVDAPDAALGDPSFDSERVYSAMPGVFFIGLNTQRAPTNNAMVRKALASSIDRRALLDDVLHMPWLEEATGVIPPELFGYQGSDVGYEYNLNYAQGALAGAGYPGGVGLPTVHVYGFDNPRNRATIEAVAEQWRSGLHISVETHYLDFDSFNQWIGECQSDPGVCNYNALRQGWVIDYYDPHNIINDLFNPDSWQAQRLGWDNARYRELIDLTRGEMDPTQRLAYLNEAEQILVEDDAAVIPLYFTERVSLVKPGFTTSFGITPNFDQWDVYVVSDIDGDGMPDLLDPCPGDAGDNCDPAGSASGVITSRGGMLVTEDSTVNINVPANAVNNNLTLNITESGSGYEIATYQGTMSVFQSYSIEPHDTHFNEPVAITFYWKDANNDGVVDGTTLEEAYIILIKDGVILTPSCSVNPNCNMSGNTLAVQVTDLSLFELAAPLQWMLKGFYPPVDMNGIYNLVKGGSTVPVKFEIFAGSTELTSTADIRSFSYAEIMCSASVFTDEIEIVVTGGNSLRYDTTTGQFIYNWKLPKTTGKCYRMTMTTTDGPSLVAFFKTK